MYKNQLQELAQRSCFNLPSYTCVREGPDHAPRFKAAVNFNGENFESPVFCTTLKQAEHAAAEVALTALSKQGPSRSLAARVLDETSVYKNLLQETAHRAGLNLPVYTTVRSGPGHTPVFTCTVELAGLSYTGDPAKNKKQAQKNAAMAAWTALKRLPCLGSSTVFGSDGNEHQEQVIVAQALAKLCLAGGCKPSPQNDRQRQLKTVSASSAPLYLVPSPYKRWIPSNVFPDIESYQLWDQKHSRRLPNPLLALPSPSAANGSRNSPYMQSTKEQYFPGTVQDHLDSSLFSGSHSLCFLPGSSTQASSKEVHEENSIIRNDGWMSTRISDVNGEPIGQNISDQSSPIMYSLYETSNCAPSINKSSEPKFKEPWKDKQGCSWSSVTDIPDEEVVASNPSFFSVASDCNPLVIHDGAGKKNMHKVQQREGRRENFEWMHPGSCLSSSPCPTCVPFTLKNPGMPPHNYHQSSTTCSLKIPRASPSLPSIARDLTRSGFPIQQAARQVDAFRARSSFLAPLVKIRTAVPVYSARPRRSELNSSAPPSFSLAPAVNVRSVAPVRSTPPVRTSNSISRISHMEK